MLRSIAAYGHWGISAHSVFDFSLQDSVGQSAVWGTGSPLLSKADTKPALRAAASPWRQQLRLWIVFCVWGAVARWWLGPGTIHSQPTGGSNLLHVLHGATQPPPWALLLEFLLSVLQVRGVSAPLWCRLALFTQLICMLWAKVLGAAAPLVPGVLVVVVIPPGSS